MIIRDMFLKEIDRDIKGVIKVGQSDDENVFQELDEYVVTSELEKYMDRFFTAYKRGVESHTDKMGVWISGFFGSGFFSSALGAGVGSALAPLAR